MNIKEKSILNILMTNTFINQRSLSDESGYSLGVVNKSLKKLIEHGYLNNGMVPTDKARIEFERNVPRRAIILAAGFGMRMVPINTEIPKGLLTVKGEPLIERIIKQLHDVNVNDIYIVVGFMKESYEYLIDEYNVKLIVNTEYASKNNLHSIELVRNYLSNAYVIPCDIWCRDNLFRRHEPYSWYMVSDAVDDESTVRVNRQMNLVKLKGKDKGNSMVGISYVSDDDAKLIADRVNYLSADSEYDDSFWEEALYRGDRMLVEARVVPSEEVFEVNTYEQLRELDGNSDQLKTDAIQVICDALDVKSDDISDISVLKKGMTNRSFLFACKGKRYIMRIPGGGTNQLINRRHEANVYKLVNGRNICDDIAYINPDNGYKITEFLDNARVCDSSNIDDVRKCMKMLHDFHSLKLKVDHEFNIFKQIEFYEKLWNGLPSAYKDYAKTKENVLSLKSYIDEHVKEKVLTHIDANPDNFIFINKSGKEEIRLIDWEYAGMQDPHVDIAMFGIYSFYDRHQMDELIDEYFAGQCDDDTRIKIYCYISACGLLWSNWCEYKRSLGEEFGEYSLKQYRYAKEYYRIVQEELRDNNEERVKLK